MSNDIFQVMEYGHILASDEDVRLLVTWNGRATYNLWSENGLGNYDNVDVATYDPTPDSTPIEMQDALVYASERLSEWAQG